jgi:hypothetical protein
VLELELTYAFTNLCYIGLCFFIIFFRERVWARVSLRGVFLYHLTNYCEATTYSHYMSVLWARILNNRNYDSYPYWLTTGHLFLTCT